MLHNKRFALITGASSGIGEAFARRLSRDGIGLILVARSKEKLHELAGALRAQTGVEAIVLARDLSLPETPEKVFAETEGNGLRVEYLINNAGFGLNAAFDEVPLERLLEMVDLNVRSLTALAHLFFRAMKARGSGGILNVASTASFVPGPYFAVYGATKAYVSSFTQALSEEASGTGVAVTCLCPGITRTRFLSLAGMEKAGSSFFPVMDAESVAEKGWAALQKGRRILVTHPLDRLWIASLRTVPGWVPIKLSGAFFRHTRDKKS